MLVINRKENQDIYIGEGIRILLVRVKGSYARIGIECSKNINVVRGELKNEKVNGNRVNI